MENVEPFEVGEVLCNKCKNTLFKYNKNNDLPEIELILNFENVVIEKFKFTHDCCCEASDQTLEFKCKNCDTKGSICTCSGGQSVEIGMWIYDKNNEEINTIVK